jgi:hypothetical protein
VDTSSVQRRCVRCYGVMGGWLFGDWAMMLRGLLRGRLVIARADPWGEERVVGQSLIAGKLIATTTNLDGFRLPFVYGEEGSILAWCLCF